MVDQEPHRRFLHFFFFSNIFFMLIDIFDFSVQVIRRIDTRIPTPLLSTFITPPPSLGKLADFRAVKGTTTTTTTTPSPVSWRSTAAATVTKPTQQGSVVPVQRGWTSVVASGTSSSSSTSTSAAATASTTTTTTHHSLVAPKPTTTSSLEVLLGGSSSGHVSSRTVSPAANVRVGSSSEPVPEDWEDDV